jgi:hypothetical protein
MSLTSTRRRPEISNFSSDTNARYTNEKTIARSSQSPKSSPIRVLAHFRRTHSHTVDFETFAQAAAWANV